MSDPVTPMKRPRPSKGKQSTPRVICEDYSDPKANVELVSSDGTVFRVHSYQLMAASVVFRGMLTDCSPASSGVIELELVDADIEDARTVRDMLDLVHTATLFNLAPLENDQRLFKLIRLLIKYDCPIALDGIRYRMRAGLSTIAIVTHFFAAAAMMDDVETCRLAIVRGGPMTWNEVGGVNNIGSIDSAGLHQCVENRSPLDILAMSDYWLDIIPTRYARALGRATLRSSVAGRITSWSAVGNEFRRLLDTTGEAKQGGAG